MFLFAAVEVKLSYGIEEPFLRSERNDRRSLAQALNSQLDDTWGGGEGELSACSLSHCRKRGSKSA